MQRHSEHGLGLGLGLGLTLTLNPNPNPNPNPNLDQACSGTVNMELALAGTPQVALYR